MRDSNEQFPSVVASEASTGSPIPGEQLGEPKGVPNAIGKAIGKAIWNAIGKAIKGGGWSSSARTGRECEGHDEVGVVAEEREHRCNRQSREPASEQGVHKIHRTERRPAVQGVLIRTLSHLVSPQVVLDTPL